MDTATSKTYYHPTGYFVVWANAISQWYLVKVLKSGKLKPHYNDGYSYKSDWKKAVAEMRQKGLNIPSASREWKRKKIEFDNTLSGFVKTLVEFHLENSK